MMKDGYDEQMGARAVARLIQENIKKALADEVLFGKLKGGGHVRVIAVKDEAGAEKLGFEYLDGPVTPKPEKIPEAKPKRRSPRRKPSRPKGASAPLGSRPEGPLVKGQRPSRDRAPPT